MYGNTVDDNKIYCITGNDCVLTNNSSDTNQESRSVNDYQATT